MGTSTSLLPFWDDLDFYVMDADGSNQTNITNNDKEDYGAVWSPSGKKLAISTNRDGNYEIYSMNIDGGNPQNLTNSPTTNEGFWAPAWSPNGRQIVSGEKDGAVKLWDANTGRNTLTMKGHTGSIHCLEFSPDGNRIISGGRLVSRQLPKRPGEIKIWDVEMAKELSSLTDHTVSGVHLAVSPDGKRIASADFGGALSVKVWDIPENTGANEKTD